MRKPGNSLPFQPQSGIPISRVVWSGALGLTSLRRDAAEAILIGLWGVLEAG